VGKRAPADDQAGPATAASPGANPAPAAGASPAAATAAASPAAKTGPNAPASPGPANPAPATAAASPATGAPPPQTVPPGPSQGTSLDSAANESGALPQYSAAWHHAHLYSPRDVNRDSTMPSFRFLYEKRRITGQRSADALVLKGKDAPPPGWEVVPSYEAKALVAYLMSLDQSHPLQEVKSNAPPSPPAPGKAAAK
jgi:hypothetical protein